MVIEKNLNLVKIKSRMEELGLSQSDLSLELEITRQAVSHWLRGSLFPRPSVLLKLGKILSLPFNELVIKKTINEPQVSFRKRGSTKTKESHIDEAKLSGYELQKLEKYLLFDTLIEPKHFRTPKVEYLYIQKATIALRKLLGVSSIGVDVQKIINYFDNQYSILIPKLSGEISTHSNALHVRLPETGTNWVFFNLDTNELDFKFWLIHELAHILTPQLEGEDSERFADDFAGAFLFPESESEDLYNKIHLYEKSRQIQIMLDYANRYTISPITIGFELNKYAKYSGKNEIELERDFYARAKTFSKKYLLMSQKYFGVEKPSAHEYIKVCETVFNSVFFKVLGKYIKENDASVSIISNLLNLPFTDSLEIYNTLKNGL